MKAFLVSVVSSLVLSVALCFLCAYLVQYTWNNGVVYALTFAKQISFHNAFCLCALAYLLKMVSGGVQTKSE